MPRKGGAAGAWRTSKQHGRNRRDTGVGTYSREQKSRFAMVYLSVPPWFRKPGSK